MTKISELPTAVTPGGADLLPIVQGGVTRKISYSALLPGGSSSYTLPPATTAALGGVIAGPGLTIGTDGTLSVAPNTYAPLANPGFSGGVAITGSSSASEGITVTGAATNETKYDTLWGPAYGGVQMRLVNDAYTAATAWLALTRSGITPVSLTLTASTIALSGNLASPTITGVPTVPTAAAGTNTTQAASCAFVLANAGSGGPTTTLSGLAVAATASSGDLLLVEQSGTDGQMTLGTVARFALGTIMPTVPLSADTALSATAHHNRRLKCTAALTLSGSASGLGDGFECRVVNTGSGSVTLGSGITASASVLAPGATTVLWSDGTTLYSTGAGTAALAVPGTPGTPSSTSVGTSTIGLQWTAPTSGGTVDYYKVLRRPTGSGSYTQIGTSTTLSYSDTGLATSTGYDYEIVAHNSSGDGATSGSVTVTTSATLTAPNTVTSLAASAATATTVTLSWTESGGTPSARTVTMRTPSGSGSYGAASGTFGATGGVVTGLTAGSSYDFQVVESNTAGTSAAATLTGISTTIAAPGAVTSLATGAVADTTAALTWTAPSTGGAVASYAVAQRTPSGSGSYTASTMSVAAGSTGGTVSGLAAGQTYDFQVTTTNAGGSSSATLTGVLTEPGAVTSLAAGTITGTTVQLTWTNAASATGWTVYQRTPSGSGSYAASTLSVAASATGATVSGLTAGSGYDFQVVASNATGASPQSATLTNVIPNSYNATITITNSGGVVAAGSGVTGTYTQASSVTSYTQLYDVTAGRAQTGARGSVSGTTGSLPSYAYGATSTQLSPLIGGHTYKLQLWSASSGGTLQGESATFTAAAQGSNTYTLTVASGGNAPPTALNMSGGASVFMPATENMVVLAGSTTPKQVRFVWTRSNSTAPVAGTDYANAHTADYVGGTGVSQSAGTWNVSTSLAIYRNGPGGAETHTTGTSETYYLWAIPLDNTGAPCVYATGCTVTY